MATTDHLILSIILFLHHLDNRSKRKAMKRNWCNQKARLSIKQRQHTYMPQSVIIVIYTNFAQNVILCHSNILANQDVQCDFNGYEKDSFLINKKKIFSSFKPNL